MHRLNDDTASTWKLENLPTPKVADLHSPPLQVTTEK